MKTKKLRIGLVGAGTHGRHAVIPSFLRSEHCVLVAIADRSAENLDLVTEWSGRKYADFDCMLAEEELDAVYIATLPNSHAPLAIKAFAQGLHVICEKPMASSVADAEAMHAAAKEADRELVIMFENRFQPHYKKIREWVPRLGRVEAIHIQTFGKHPLAQPRRTDLINASGALDCGIHMLDLVRFWTGAVSWETIHAFGAWFGEPVERAPHMAILARLDNGVMVSFEDSLSFGYHAQTIPWNFEKKSLSIIGERGVIVDIDGCKGYQIMTDEFREEVEHRIVEHSDEIPEVIDHLAMVLAGTAEDTGLLARVDDGLEAQRIVDEVNIQCIAKSKFLNAKSAAGPARSVTSRDALAAV